MSVPKKVLEAAFALPPSGKADLVDCLLASLDAPGEGIQRIADTLIGRIRRSY